MPADLYRDAHLGIRARAEELAARIREREAELTDAYWSSAEDGVLTQRAATREALEVLLAGKDLSFEDMARLEAVLAGWADELDRLIAAMPAVEAEWGVSPDDVLDPPRPAGISHDFTFVDVMRELRDGFEAMVRGRHPAAVFMRDGPTSFVARFRERDAPFTLRATALKVSELGVDEVMMQLQTSVRRSMPKLSLRHETFFMAFGKAFGVRQEIEVGEPSFDGLFLIQGDEEAARRFLVPNVRSLLLALARFDVPTLEVDPPGRLARLSWRFEPNVKALELAQRVLLSLRDLTSEVHFLRH